MADAKPVYDFHVFCCSTTRPPEIPHPSCGAQGGMDLAVYLKEKTKLAELERVRINPAQCLGMCDRGPAVVVYPEGTWYQVRSREDMDEILETHLKEGRVVERLRMPAPETGPGDGRVSRGV